MKIVDNFLKRLHGEEDPIVKQIRNSKKFIWLYHGTKEEFLDDIRKNGLKVDKMGTNMGAISYHPSKKQALSYTTNKMYAMTYTRGNIKEPLLVLVPTKDLFFGTGGRFNEYISTYNISKQNIIFPDDLKYKKIEKDNKYLMDKI